MKELIIETNRKNLNHVLAFVDERLEQIDCPMTTQITIDVAVEEKLAFKRESKRYNQKSAFYGAVWSDDCTALFGSTLSVKYPRPSM